MLLAGYQISGEYLPWGGFEGFNEIPFSFIAHRECAYNHEDLHNLVEYDEVRPVAREEAGEQGYVCCYCERSLTAKAYYHFQPEYRGGEDR